QCPGRSAWRLIADRVSRPGRAGLLQGDGAASSLPYARTSRSGSDNQVDEATFLHGGNAAYLDELYARFLEDPASVDPSWQAYFSGLKEGAERSGEELRGPSWRRDDWPPRPAEVQGAQMG